ncbi:hypothetical protein Tco_0413014 [Tanacetum coccineum]
MKELETSDETIRCKLERFKEMGSVLPDAVPAALCTLEDGVPGISVTIDRKVKVLVSEASIRRHLKLEDSEGLSSLPNANFFTQLAIIGTFLDVLSAAKVLGMRRPKQGRSGGLYSNLHREEEERWYRGSGGVSTASESDSTAGGKAKDKGKEIMQEPEPPKKLKKRRGITFILAR